jgi:predicted RNase H-like HicB family nuclease
VGELDTVRPARFPQTQALQGLADGCFIRSFRASKLTVEARVSVQLNREKSAVQATEIPILCRFWLEDGVWNGEAVHLPVAVFGSTLEESMRHLGDALLTHLEAEQQVGTIERTVEYLKICAKENCMTIEEMAPHRFLSRFNAAVQDQRVMALV